MGTMLRRSVFAILCIFLIPGIASSAQPCYNGMLNIPAASMQPRLETQKTNNVGGFVMSNSTGHVNFYAPVLLPQGAKITKMEMDAYDSSTTASIDIELRRSQWAAAGGLASIDTTASAAPGDQRYTLDNLDITIDNINYAYYIDLHFWNVGSTGNRFYRVMLYYELYDCPRSAVVIPLY